MIYRTIYNRKNEIINIYSFNEYKKMKGIKIMDKKTLLYGKLDDENSFWHEDSESSEELIKNIFK